MNEWWNNNRLVLNGHVQSPIVLWSDREKIIAQDAHNLIWNKYRSEFDSTDDAGRQALTEKVKPQIDALITKEISYYRQSRESNPLQELEERIEELENELEEIRDLAQEAMDLAEEAQSQAEEAMDKIEELEEDDDD